MARFLRNPLQALTPRTVVDPEGLRGQIEVIRERGYALSEEERDHGVVAVAAAIVPRLGHPEASVSVSAPTTRLQPDDYAQVGRLVVETVSRIVDDIRTS